MSTTIGGDNLDIDNYAGLHCLHLNQQLDGSVGEI